MILVNYLLAVEKVQKNKNKNKNKNHETNYLIGGSIQPFVFITIKDLFDDIKITLN